MRPKPLALFALAALGAAGCTRTNPPPGGPSVDGVAATTQGRRTLSVRGSDTMVILAQRWAEEYTRSHSTVVVEVAGGGSATGIAAMLNGAVDICESSRPMKAAERAELLARRGEPALETKVALDAVAVFVNPSNPVREILDPRPGGGLSRRDHELEGFGGVDHAIVLYGRENSSGTYGYFKERVLSGRDFSPATQTLAGTSAVASAVRADEFGIGYGGVAYLEGVRALAVKTDAESPGVVPSLETAQGGTYPVSRALYFYTAGVPTPVVRDFMTWVTGPDGQRTVSDVGYYPLPRRR